MSSPEEGVSIRFICPESPPPLPEQGLSRFRDWRREGRLGFLSLPGDLTLLRQCTELWEEVRTKLDPSDVVVAGIGGSALGLRALRSACGAGPRNAGRDVRFHLVDSPDVETIDRVTSVADPRRTLLVAITKSGGTAETLACFMELLGWLDEESGMVVAVTDPEKGDLRRLARSRGWRTLPVPPAVGGRFSVLSPVGLFPAMVLGIDCAALLEGAASALEDFDSNGMESVAGRLARAFLAHFVTHRVHAFFPYCDALFETALWFAQLWGESLGKKLDLDGRQVSIGQTPIACRGPADQHSLLQLFMEGPPDTFLTFLVVRQEIRPLPGGFGDLPAFCYLEGRSLEELRSAEALATATALRERGLPLVLLDLADHSERTMGQLLMQLEIATVLTGLCLNVDPLVQPGVERAKVLTYRAMGRPGYGEIR